ncbi:MAG TPA: type II toxin-antitoxin system RelE/ParE family toxin [Blastocatellia bacterium]
MPSVEWRIPAFEQLEALPLSVAFEIVRRVDLLDHFPNAGVKFTRPAALAKFHQLIVDLNYRVIYEFDDAADIVWIFAVQHCRRKLPSARDLARARRLTE